MAHIELESGEAIKAETGAMVSMSSNIELQTETGGLLGAFKRSIGGESLFLNTFRAQGKGDLQLAPAYPGDVESLRQQRPSIPRAVHSWQDQRMWR